MNIPPTRLLIVDDERHIRSAMARALSLMGHETVQAASGQEALTLLSRERYDLMLLDLQMPGINGLEVIQRVHQIAPGLPVIIFTGHATLESAITAVKSEEVLDYLMKPATVHQVAAAIKEALYKRHHPKRPLATQPDAESAPEQFLHVPPLTFDRQQRIVTWDHNPDETYELTKSEAAVLVCFLERPNHVFTCQELGRAVWGHHVTEDFARGPIRSIIFRLRSKIEANAQNESLIRTVRSGGYIFSPPPESK